MRGGVRDADAFLKEAELGLSSELAGRGACGAV